MKNNKVLLTIGIPLYNSQEVIRETLDSIVNQVNDDLLQVCDLEVLICDNCSTDNSAQIINKEYIEKYPDINIRYHKNEVNVGAPKNIGVVFDNAKGDYIWLFGDDAFCDESIKYNCQLILKHKANLVLNHNITFQNNFNPESILHYPDVINDHESIILEGCKEILTNEYVRHNLFFISVLVIKKNLWKEVMDKGYDNLYPHAQVLLECIANNKIKLCIASKPMIKCRYTKNVVDDLYKHLIFIFKIMKKSRKKFNDKKLFIEFFKRIHWPLFELWLDNGGMIKSGWVRGRVFVFKILFYSIYPRSNNKKIKLFYKICFGKKKL